MLKKSWFVAALLLILIGGTGVYAFDFKVAEETPAYSKTWTIEQEDLKQLFYDNDRALSVRFEPAEDGKTTVTLSGNMRQKQIDALQDIKADNGTLDIDIPNESFRLLDFNFDPWNDRQQLVVKLKNPDALDLFSLHSSSGSVKVTGAFADEIDIKADSGSITLNDLKGKEILIHSGSGSITVKGLTGPSAITAGSGSVKLSEMNGPSTVDVGSGSVRFAQAAESTDSVTIKTGSGSVRVTPSERFQGHYDLRSSSGSVYAPDRQPTSDEIIKVRSGSGSIRVY